MAGKRSTLPHETLQELLDDKPEIRQMELVELAALRRTLDRAKDEFDSMMSLVAEKLVLGYATQKGFLTARLDERGGVVVSEQEELAQSSAPF